MCLIMYIGRQRAASLKSTYSRVESRFFFLERKKTLPYTYVIGGGRSVPFILCVHRTAPAGK